MLRFTFKGFTLAHMDLQGATIEQIKAGREVIAGIFSLNLYSVRIIIK